MTKALDSQLEIPQRSTEQGGGSEADAGEVGWATCEMRNQEMIEEDLKGCFTASNQSEAESKANAKQNQKQAESKGCESKEQGKV